MASVSTYLAIDPCMILSPSVLYVREIRSGLLPGLGCRSRSTQLNERKMRLYATTRKAATLTAK